VGAVAAAVVRIVVGDRVRTGLPGVVDIADQVSADPARRH
jgi:hypothetical protein